MKGYFKAGFKKVLSLTVASCMFVSASIAGFADNNVSTTIPEANQKLISAIEKNVADSYNQTGKYALKMDMLLKNTDKKVKSPVNQMTMGMDVTGTLNKMQVGYEGNVSVSMGKAKAVVEGALYLDMESGVVYFKLPTVDKYIKITEEDLKSEMKSAKTSPSPMLKMSTEEMKDYQKLSNLLMASMAKNSFAKAKVASSDENLSLFGTDTAVTKLVVTLDNEFVNNIIVDFLKGAASDSAFKELMMKNAVNDKEKKDVEKSFNELKKMAEDQGTLSQIKLMAVLLNFGNSTATYYVDKATNEIVKSAVDFSVEYSPVALKFTMDYTYKSDSNAVVITEDMAKNGVSLKDAEKDQVLKAQLAKEAKLIEKKFNSLEKAVNPPKAKKPTKKPAKKATKNLKKKATKKPATKSGIQIVNKIKL